MKELMGGGLEEMAGDVEEEDLRLLQIADSLLEEAGISLSSLQDELVRAEAAEKDGGEYNGAGEAALNVSLPGHGRDKTVEARPADLQMFNTGNGLFADAGAPPATVKDVLVHGPAAGSGNNCASERPVFVPMGGLQKGQGQDSRVPSAEKYPVQYAGPSTSQGFWAPPAGYSQAGNMYRPVYQQPYQNLVPPGFYWPQQSVWPRAQRRERRHATAWTPYPVAPPQAYPQVSFPAQQAGGSGVNRGASTSQRINVAVGGPGVAVAGYGLPGVVGWPVYGKNMHPGAPFNYPPKPTREKHNEKERVRRSRLKIAWASLRQFVPGLNENSDNATVCDRAADYTQEMNKVLSAMFEPDERNSIIWEFLEKFQPC